MRLVAKRDSSIDQLFIWYMVFGLALLSGAFDMAFASGSSAGDITDSTNNSKRLAVLLLVYVISLVFLVLFPSKRISDIGFHPLILLIILVPVASIAWSASPDLSAKRAIAHALTVIFVLTIAVRCTIEEFFRAMMVVFAIIAAVTLLLVVGMPGVAVESSGLNAGSWKGAFGHKADLGRIAAMGLAIAIFFPAKDKGMKRIRLFMIPAFLLIIVMTQSRIAWGTLGIAIMAGLVLKIMRWRTLDVSVRAIMFFGTFSLVILGAALAFEPVILASGRDLTFSGRTNLWESAIAVAQVRHPYLGAGYGAFWTKASAVEVLRYMPHWGKLPNHGHNGYVDAWLEMGYVGLFTLVGVTILTIGTVLRRVVDRRTGDYWFMLLLVNIQFMFINLGGTISFKHSEIFWIMFIAPLLFRLQYGNNPARTTAPSTPNRIPRPDQYMRPTPHRPYARF